MKQINLIAISIFLLVTNFVTGQTQYARGEIHKIYSFNNNYFLRTIPNEDAERTEIGNTIVYKADSTELYKFPRYFEFGYFDQQVFLNNDGSTITNIANGDLNFYNYQQKCITIYKNGKLFKEYALHDIIDCDSKDNRECKLFYFKDAIENVSYDSNHKKTIIFKKNATDFEKQLTRNPLYQSNDTLLVFCKMGQIIKLNLSTGDFIKEKLNTFDTKSISWFDTLHIQSYKVINSITLNEFPKMINGKVTEKELVDYMGMRICNERNSDKYKNYELSILAVVDIQGCAKVVDIKNYRYNGVPAEDKIYAFFKGNKFETKHIPKGVDGWKFYCSIKVMNQNLEKAKEELEKETKEKRDKYIKRTLADSLNGHYIPKHIEECFVELNKLLKPETVDGIKKLKSRDETSNYHMGLGLWLRNNWGLWGGSRLQVYLTNKDLNHPDDMSGLILEYYYDWLNGINQGWQEFDKKEKPKEIKK